MARQHWIWIVTTLLLSLWLVACGGSFDKSASHPELAAYGRATPAAGSASAEPASMESAPGAPESDLDSDGGGDWEAVPPSAVPPSAAPAPEQPGKGGPVAAPAEENAGPLLIYTAQVHLAVFETEQALGVAEKIMRDARGYLVQRTNRNITFRVPAEKFQGALAAVLALGDVLHQEVKARDVTDEFHDTQTRLRTLEALRGRLEELLARADKVEDALAVERELGRIVTEIERLKGRLKLMRELVAFSTLTVELQPRAEKTLVSSDFYLPFPWLQSLGLGELLSL